MGPTMVRAILEGKKTVTRRPLKYRKSGTAKCPYGGAGDLLYVKETFVPDPNRDHESWSNNSMTAVEWDGCGMPVSDVPEPLKTPKRCLYRATTRHGRDLYCLWKASIFMPKWAARIWLEVTSVRSKRLQDITPEDIVAEGLTRIIKESKEDSDRELMMRFCATWNKIYYGTEYIYKNNPEVWRVEFKIKEIIQ